MNDVLPRIRKIFLDSEKGQTEIGKMIDKTPQYIWRIMNIDDLSPSKSTIKEICRVFNVREEWVYTGAEPMRYPPENEAAAYVDNLLGGEENPLYDLIRAIMKTYSELGPDDQKVIKSFAKSLKENQNSESRG